MPPLQIVSMPSTANSHRCLFFICFAGNSYFAIYGPLETADMFTTWTFSFWYIECKPLSSTATVIPLDKAIVVYIPMTRIYHIFNILILVYKGKSPDPGL